MQSGIYKITCLANSKVYIGSTDDFIQREYEHFVALENKRHHSILLQRAYNIHGRGKFIFEIIEYVDRELNENIVDFRNRLARNREQYYLDQCGAQEFINRQSKRFRELTYNIKPTAHSSLGKPVSLKTRRKQSQAQLGKSIHKNVREKISKGLIKYFSENVSVNKGIVGNRLGSKMTAEAIQKRTKTRQVRNNYKCKESKRLAMQKPVIQLSLDGQFIKEWPSITEAKIYLRAFNIGSACLDSNKTSGGFKWQYKSNSL